MPHAGDLPHAPHPPPSLPPLCPRTVPPGPHHPTPLPALCFPAKSLAGDGPGSARLAHRSGACRRALLAVVPTVLLRLIPPSEMLTTCDTARGALRPPGSEVRRGAHRLPMP